MIGYCENLIRSLRSQLHRVAFIAISLCLLILSPLTMAAQNALISVDRAVIYADQKMSAPIGFLRRGKSVRIGEIPKNKAQVYPIIISGKVAYIRALDVDVVAQKKGAEFQTERFQKNTEAEHSSNYSISFVRFASQISLEKDNGGLKDKDNFDFSGISLYGEAAVSNRFDIDIILNYLEGKNGDEVFRIVEVGGGPAFRILDTHRLKLRWFAHLLLIPFTNYAYGDKFRMNSFGVSGGSGLKFDFYFAENWAVEFTGGVFYTKLLEFDAPKNYQSISPSFMGTRTSIGLNYRF